jgi:hypothetical protein
MLGGAGLGPLNLRSNEVKVPVCDFCGLDGKKIDVIVYEKVEAP